MILHIPHSSIYLNGEARPIHDQIILTDHFTDELFFCENSERVVFKYSRLICDVERFENDMEPMYEKGFGICYTKTLFGDDINLTQEDIDRSMKLYFEHHKKLNIETQKQLTMKPYVVVVDCHSFNEDSLSDGNKSVDFCIGANDHNTPVALVNIIVKEIEQNGYTVAVNEPFKGSMTPSNHLNNINVGSVMIEVNKALYLNDGLADKSVNFKKTEYFINNLLNLIANFEVQMEK